MKLNSTYKAYYYYFLLGYLVSHIFLYITHYKRLEAADILLHITEVKVVPA